MAILNVGYEEDHHRWRKPAPMEDSGRQGPDEETPRNLAKWLQLELVPLMGTPALDSLKYSFGAVTE